MDQEVGGLTRTKLIDQGTLTGQALLYFATYNLVQPYEAVSCSSITIYLEHRTAPPATGNNNHCSTTGFPVAASMALAYICS